MTGKIKILFLGSNPTDEHQLRLAKEAREIENEIQAASEREHFDLDSQLAVRPDDLQRALLRIQPHIVHFGGHGNQAGELILEDNDGKSRPVSKHALIGLFNVLKDNVRIIILNACYSRPQAEALSEVIDYTVGTSKAIKDKSAVAFATAFYRALAFGRSVQDAFELAKLQIDMNGLSGSDAPVLMVRDGVNSAEPFLRQLATQIEPGGRLPGATTPEDRLTALANVFDRLAGGTASDEDRRLFRRAIFDGKAMLIPGEGESGVQDAASKLTVHGGRLHIELGAELFRQLHEQLYPAPHGLPPPLPGSIFLGRENDLSNIKQRLGVNVTPPAAGELTIVRGWPGVGKTTFVSVICRDPEIARSFPDGVLWTYLDQEPELFSKLAAWGRALTGSDELLRVPTLNEAAARLAELLRHRRMLLVVDDIWKAEHAVPFLQAGGDSQCAMLLTTRLPQVATDLADDSRRIYALPVLTEDSSLSLLRHLIPAIVEQHEPLCRELAHDLEYLPLSLHIAGRALRRDAEMGFDVVNSIHEIREGAIVNEPAPLNMAVTGSRHSLKTLLERSVSRLDDHARECFTFLGAFAPKPATFDLAAMQAVWQVPDARPIVKKLAGLGLLEPVGGRYQMHAVLVDYARSLFTD